MSTNEEITIQTTLPDELVLDLTNVSTEFEPLPVGIYQAVVENVEYEPVSKKSGQPYLKFTYKITDSDFSGRNLWDNYSLQPDALWKLVKALSALGFELPRGQVSLRPAEWIGLPCSLSVSVEDYKGKLKNTVQEVLEAEPTATS